MINRLFLRMTLTWFLIFGVTDAYALSNESTDAKNTLTQIESDMILLISKHISVTRINETYQDALQIYSAQMALELKGKQANFRFVIEAGKEISKIKDDALRASDELWIFIDQYKEYSKKMNLSEMDTEYNGIILSFNEERFEDTLKLIDAGYERMSEIQSSQTALNLFYLSTSRTIKNFLKEYWIYLLAGLFLSIVALWIFWKRITRWRLKKKLSYLELQKTVLNELIKKLQRDYFEKKTISLLEYNIKIKKFEEMIRDIDRQVPLIRGELFKINRNQPVSENFEKRVSGKNTDQQISKVPPKKREFKRKKLRTKRKAIKKKR